MINKMEYNFETSLCILLVMLLLTCIVISSFSRAIRTKKGSLEENPLSISFASRIASACVAVIYFNADSYISYKWSYIAFANLVFICLCAIITLSKNSGQHLHECISKMIKSFFNSIHKNYYRIEDFGRTRASHYIGLIVPAVSVIISALMLMATHYEKLSAVMFLLISIFLSNIANLCRESKTRIFKLFLLWFVGGAVIGGIASSVAIDLLIDVLERVEIPKAIDFFAPTIVYMIFCLGFALFCVVSAVAANYDMAKITAMMFNSLTTIFIIVINIVIFLVSNSGNLQVQEWIANSTVSIEELTYGINLALLPIIIGGNIAGIANELDYYYQRKDTNPQF